MVDIGGFLDVLVVENASMNLVSAKRLEADLAVHHWELSAKIGVRAIDVRLPDFRNKTQVASARFMNEGCNLDFIEDEELYVPSAGMEDFYVVL